MEAADASPPSTSNVAAEEPEPDYDPFNEEPESLEKQTPEEAPILASDVTASVPDESNQETGSTEKNLAESSTVEKDSATTAAPVPATDVIAPASEESGVESGSTEKAIAESSAAEEASVTAEESGVESGSAQKTIAKSSVGEEATLASDGIDSATTAVEATVVTAEVSSGEAGDTEKKSVESRKAEETSSASKDGNSSSTAISNEAKEPAKSETGASNLPDNIARLPPKLRARLLARGILKEQDLQASGTKAEASPSTVSCPPPKSAPVGAPPASISPGTPPVSSAPATPPVKGAPGTPPESSAEQTPGALCKAAPPPAGSLSKAAPPPAGSLSKAAPPAPGSLKKAGAPAVAGLTPSTVADLQAQMQTDLQALQEKRRVAWLEAMKRQEALDAEVEKAKEQTLSVSASAKKKPAPVKTVYSSAPVINKGGESTPEEKTEVVESPANLRAAAAKAESAAAAPVWVYKDGVVTEMNGNKARKVEKEKPTVQEVAPTTGVAAVGAVSTPQVAETEMAMPPPPGPPPGPPLPAGWVRVPHEGDFYFWNTSTNEVSWEHPSLPKAAPEPQVFKEEHRILKSDLAKVIGRQGINLKIIKESIGCSINVPREKGKGKGKDDKGKGKGKKGKKTPEEQIRGAGTGAEPIPDEAFVTVSITADDAHKARGGKRCLEVMLGYGKRVEAALEALGVQAKYPKLADEIKGGPGDKPKDEVDPMDPSSYSDAPQGGWSRGIPKPGVAGRSGPEPRDSKTANAERF